MSVGEAVIFFDRCHWLFHTFIGGGARLMFAWDADPTRVDALAHDIRAVSSRA